MNDYKTITKLFENDQDETDYYTKPGFEHIFYNTK